MQPCSREMQGMNSVLTSLQDLHSSHQIQMHPSSSSHFDSSSHDDFLDQILSSVPSSSWSDLTPINPKPFWDLQPSNNPRDISDAAENAVFQFDDHASLASKFRNHQISTGSSTKSSTALMLQAQQQLLMSRGVSGLLPMPLSLGGGDFDRSRNNVVDGSPFKSPNPGGEGSVQTLFNGIASSLHHGSNGQASNQTQHFPHPQNFAASGSAPNQAPAAASGGPAQPRQRVRARRGQATDPHSIAERLRRERIAERMKALQELFPNSNKTDKASMLDEIIDYVKFLQLQVKVLSMSRLGGAAAVAPLIADMASDQGRGGASGTNTSTHDCIKPSSGGPLMSRNNQTASSSSNDNSLTMTEQQVAKLMEEDMGSAMQYLQGKGLCLMPISLATAISTATCHSRNPLTVQSATVGNVAADGSVSNG